MTHYSADGICVVFVAAPVYDEHVSTLAIAGAATGSVGLIVLSLIIVVVVMRYLFTKINTSFNYPHFRICI